MTRMKTKMMMKKRRSRGGISDASCTRSERWLLVMAARM